MVWAEKARIETCGFDGARNCQGHVQCRALRLVGLAILQLRFAAKPLLQCILQSLCRPFDDLQMTIKLETRIPSSFPKVEKPASGFTSAT